MLPVHSTSCDGREVDIRAAIRQLVIHDDATRTTGRMRNRHARRRGRIGAAGRRHRGRERRTLDESIRSESVRHRRTAHSEKHSIRRTVVKLGQRRALVAPRIVDQERCGTCPRNPVVAVERKHVHLRVGRYQRIARSAGRKTACKHMPGGCPVIPELIIESS